MTDKEYVKVKLIVASVILFLLGISAGAVIVSFRIDAEIRADQLELQAQVAEIIKDKAKIDDLNQQLIFHIKQLQLEQQRLYRLQIELSKGENPKK